MTTGTISSLGVGSGLDLQSLLEQLREVDEEALVRQADEITTYESQINEFTEVNNKLLAFKHEALDLSLASPYLERVVTSSDEKVLTATVLDGTSVQNNTVTVDRLATKSSWISAGVADGDASINIPTSQESTTGVADSAVDAVVSVDGSLDIEFGDGNVISVAVGPTAGVTTMDQLVDAINTDAANVSVAGDNGRFVTASTYLLDGQSYLRVASDVAGGTGEDHRVALTSNDTDLIFSPPSQTLVYSMGDGDPVSVEVSADLTVSQLVDLINNDENNPGVTASLIDDGSATDPYKMVLQANVAGSEQEITFLSQLSDLTMGLSPGGETGETLNSQVTIDGISYQRQSNSVSDIMSGITLNLQGVGDTSLSVSDNKEGLKEKVVALVETYNDVVQEVQTNTSYNDETEEFGLLYSTTMRDLPFSLQTLMTTSYEGSADNITRTYDEETNLVTVVDSNIHSMYDLGMAFERDGSITIDESVLSEALETNGENVQAFFLGDEESGVEGFADNVNGYLRQLTSYNGQVEAEKTAAQQRIDELSQSIEDQTIRLDKKYDLLAQQFVALDSYMSQMTSISNYLTGQFDSLSDGWGQVGGSN